MRRTVDMVTGTAAIAFGGVLLLVGVACMVACVLIGLWPVALAGVLITAIVARRELRSLRELRASRP